MISATIIGQETVMKRFLRVQPTVRSELEKAITTLSIKLQRHVTQDKLTGEVLNVKTGRLRRSINYRVENQGTDINGYVGTNVNYGRAWELGFSRKVGAGARGGTKLTGKALQTYMAKHPAGIKQYAPRSFLRSALADMASQIKSGIEQATREAAKKI